jgi:hypothetical protein
VDAADVDRARRLTSREMTTIHTIEIGGVVLALLLMLDRLQRRRP